MHEEIGAIEYTYTLQGKSKSKFIETERELINHKHFVSDKLHYYENCYQNLNSKC